MAPVPPVAQESGGLFEQTSSLLDTRIMQNMDAKAKALPHDVEYSGSVSHRGGGARSNKVGSVCHRAYASCGYAISSSLFAFECMQAVPFVRVSPVGSAYFLREPSKWLWQCGSWYNNAHGLMLTIGQQMRAEWESLSLDCAAAPCTPTPSWPSITYLLP